MFQEFFMKKMLQSQLKNVPEAQRQQMIELVTKNPELFMKIGKEIQERMKQGPGRPGKGQMAAAVEVMREHGEEIKKLM